MTLLVGSIFHMTRKIVSEMTYNVSMGTLNLLYHTCIAITVKTSSATVGVHIRIVPHAFTLRRPSFTKRLQRRHVLAVCSRQAYTKTIHIIIIIIIIIITLVKTKGGKNRNRKCWKDFCSRRSSNTKPSCNKTELNRNIETEMRWNKKEVSLSSPELREILRPMSERNWRASQFKGPRDSKTIGWKQYYVIYLI